MSKVRIYTLAKDHDLSTDSILEAAAKLNIAIKNHMSAITESEADKILATLKKTKAPSNKTTTIKKATATVKNEPVEEESALSKARKQMRELAGEEEDFEIAPTEKKVEAAPKPQEQRTASRIIRRSTTAATTADPEPHTIETVITPPVVEAPVVEEAPVDVSVKKPRTPGAPRIQQPIIIKRETREPKIESRPASTPIKKEVKLVKPKKPHAPANRKQPSAFKTSLDSLTEGAEHESPRKSKSPSIEVTIEYSKREDDVPAKTAASTADEIDKRVPDSYKYFERYETNRTQNRKKPVRPVQQQGRRVEKNQHGRSVYTFSKKRGPGQEPLLSSAPTKASKRVVKVSEGIQVMELAKQMSVKVGDVIKKLMGMGMMVTANQLIDHDSATLAAAEFGFEVENTKFEEQTLLSLKPENPEDLITRPPVVTIMGHVDHGKTSLLDAIRKTKVTQSEAGGITQHIGAYDVDIHGKKIAFIDTPGHEAFTAMRARGAKATDIVVLVVAANDGVMPQTVEAIHHATEAKAPIIVAINKMDLPDANPERVIQQLMEHHLVPEKWGGTTIYVNVSAKSKEGIPELLEMILLQADVMDLKTNPNRDAEGLVIEAKLDRGRGPVATILVQNGTLRTGQMMIAGDAFGKIRAMYNDLGQKVDVVTASIPVEVLGLDNVPSAGDPMNAVPDEKILHSIIENRRMKTREKELLKSSKTSLEDLFSKIEQGKAKELRLIIKGDTTGSVEALDSSFAKLVGTQMGVKIIHSGTGGITESDVMLASASDAVIIGFNIRPELKASELAEREGVDIKLFSIIYDAVNAVKDAMEGLLEPILKEEVLGRAEVKNVFSIPKQGTIAGTAVTQGKILRNASVRLIRDSVVVYQGRIKSLRRFKDDVREVATGYECGIGIENYNDVKMGDVIEAFMITKTKGSLDTPAEQ